MFFKDLFLLLMIQDPKMCTELGVDKIIIGHEIIKIFVLRRLICKADFQTQIEQEIFVEKLYVAGREAFCHGDCLIKYQDFIISNEEFERFSINENAADWNRTLILFIEEFQQEKQVGIICVSEFFKISIVEFSNKSRIENTFLMDNKYPTTQVHTNTQYNGLSGKFLNGKVDKPQRKYILCIYFVLLYFII